MTAGDTAHGYPILMPGEGDGYPLSGPTEHVAVSFEGGQAGVEELTWGQRSIWAAMARHGSWLPMGGSKPLDAGVSAEDVADELRYLMTRFPSMRTRLRFDTTGHPTQELFGSGEIGLDIYDVAEDGTEPDQLAAAVEAHLRHTPYDFADHWPVRMAVVPNRGELTHMVAIICHIATDGAGARVMLREVASRTSTPSTGLQPLEQARWQGSPAGRRQNETALRYHEDVLRTISPRRLPDSPDPRSPRHWSGEFRSRALGPAANAIAQRTGAASSPVLMALFAIALARITGINPVVTRPLVSNRFRPSLADVVCMLVLPGICVLDVADATVDETVARAQRAVMRAYKHGYYDSQHLEELISQSPGNEAPTYVSCLFNDRRDEQRQQPASAPPTAEELHSARDNSTFSWAGRSDRPSERMFLTIEDEPDGLLLIISADTHFFPPAHFEALTRGIEDVAVEAALDPTAPTKVTTTD